MSLSLQSRRVGEVTVVTCAGRLVAGEETATFERHVDGLMAMTPDIVLDLADVAFIDSAGLGMLVRYLTRARNAHGALTIGAPSAKLVEVLKITRLDAVFQPYDTVADAIADAHRPGARADASFENPTILCVDTSPDVLSFLRELIKGAGYGVLTAANLADALILLVATTPRAVVIRPELRETSEIDAPEQFHRLANARAVIELPPNFAVLDAGDAAEQVLNAVRAQVPGV